MTADRVLVSAAAAYVAAAVFGSAVAMRQDIPGEPFGVGIPLTSARACLQLVREQGQASIRAGAGASLEFVPELEPALSSCES